MSVLFLVVFCLFLTSMFLTAILFLWRFTQPKAPGYIKLNGLDFRTNEILPEQMETILVFNGDAVYVADFDNNDIGGSVFKLGDEKHCEDFENIQLWIPYDEFIETLKNNCNFL